MPAFNVGNGILEDRGEVGGGRGGRGGRVDGGDGDPG